jgi:hypothetical protein
MPEQQHPEGEPGESGRQPGREPQGGLGVTHPPEPGHERGPDSCQRREVQPVAAGLLEVVELAEVDQGGLCEVVLREIQLADLGGDHRLHAGGQR